MIRFGSRTLAPSASTPWEARGLRQATTRVLGDLDAILSYEAPDAYTYRGWVFHGTTKPKWASTCADRGHSEVSQVLHLSSNLNECKEYAQMQTFEDGGPPLVLRLALSAIPRTFLLGPDLGFVEQWEQDEWPNLSAHPTALDTARELGFFTLVGDIESIKSRFTAFTTLGGPEAWTFRAPPGRAPRALC